MIDAIRILTGIAIMAAIFAAFHFMPDIVWRGAAGIALVVITAVLGWLIGYVALRRAR